MTSATPTVDTVAASLVRLSREPLSRLLANQDVAAVVRQVTRQAGSTERGPSSTVDVAAFGSAI